MPNAVFINASCQIATNVTISKHFILFGTVQRRPLHQRLATARVVAHGSLRITRRPAGQVNLSWMQVRGIKRAHRSVANRYMIPVVTDTAITRKRGCRHHKAAA